jgi:serine/threonine protein kinase
VNPHGGAPASHDASAPKACPTCGARYAADALFCSLDGSPLTTSPGAIAAAAANDYYVGREILGHIEIRQLVGLGAMGRVYRAFQRGIDRDVAVKILHRELSANPAVVARFNREAKVAARLSHPNVVHVLLVGQLPDGAMYIVMEYLDGLSLQSALAAAGGALPLPRALHIAIQLCDAAGEAHAQGIVHRDLKPENIMLIERADDPDFVKVLDFGIARLSWADPSMATAAGLIFGTARYISPEGAGGEKVGPQGDVYSMATMLYQMLAGRTPFDADQAVALLVQQIHDTPLPLKSIPRAAYVPEPIAATVMKNLAKRPDERAESARAFGRALLEAAMASGLSAQDILARPSLLPGGRSRATSIQMPSMARTQQVGQLGPEPASVTSSPPDTRAVPVGPGGTVYETPSPGSVDGFGPSGDGRDGRDGREGREGRTTVRTEIADPTTSPPGVATAKWVPPASVRATLVTTPTTPPSRPSSSVDPTLADEPAPKAPGSTRAAGRLWVAGAVAFAGLALAAVAFTRGSAKPGAAGSVRASSASVTSDVREERAPLTTLEQAPPQAAPLASIAAVPPLVGVTASPGAPPASGPLRVAVETSSARPGVGQPVDLSARVAGGATGHPRVEGPRFRIAGLGIPPGTELTAPDDGSGVFRTTFTFFQPGRFEVAFLARADGAPVRSARVVVVDDPSAPATAPQPAPQQASSAPPANAAAPPAKWM